MNPLDIFLNGTPVQTQATDLQALLQERGQDLNAAFACAINNQFVPRVQWPQRPLQAGDRIELIAPITGG